MSQSGCFFIKRAGKLSGKTHWRVYNLPEPSNLATHFRSESICRLATVLLRFVLLKLLDLLLARRCACRKWGCSPGRFQFTSTKRRRYDLAGLRWWAQLSILLQQVGAEERNVHRDMRWFIFAQVWHVSNVKKSDKCHYINMTFVTWILVKPLETSHYRAFLIANRVRPRFPSAALLAGQV